MNGWLRWKTDDAKEQSLVSLIFQASTLYREVFITEMGALCQFIIWHPAEYFVVQIQCLWHPAWKITWQPCVEVMRRTLGCLLRSSYLKSFCLWSFRYGFRFLWSQLDYCSIPNTVFCRFGTFLVHLCIFTQFYSSWAKMEVRAAYSPSRDFKTRAKDCL